MAILAGRVMVHGPMSQLLNEEVWKSGVSSRTWRRLTGGVRLEQGWGHMSGRVKKEKRKETGGVREGEVRIVKTVSRNSTSEGRVLE